MRTVFKPVAIILTMFVATVSLSAQTLQKGVVQEYRGKDKKSPLANVELSVRNASSTVSDKKGHYELQFNTLKPGDKVNVRRIEKLGYEIFNKEALEQWYISSGEDLFTIVMVRSDRMKKLRDEYSRVSSSSYEKQYNVEKARLDEERKKNRLTQQEYEKKILALEEHYDYQLTQLDNYVDRFSRIDLSELSKEEIKIIELVRQGNVDEAIKRYDDMDLVRRIHEQADEKAEIDQAVATLSQESGKKADVIDNLFVSLMNKLNTYLLQGGQANYKKVVDECNLIAENKNIGWKYKLNLLQYLKDADGLKILGSIDFEEIDEVGKYFLAREMYVISAYLCGQIGTAYEQTMLMLDKAKELDNKEYIIKGELFLADLYIYNMQVENAYEIYLKYKHLLDDVDEADEVVLSDDMKIQVAERLTGCFQLSGNYVEALKYAEISYRISRGMYERNATFQTEKKAVQGALLYALALNEAGSVDESFGLLDAMLPLMEAGWEEYPFEYYDMYRNALGTMAIIYFHKQQYDEAEQTFIKELDVVKRGGFLNIDSQNLPTLSVIYNNLGFLYFNVGDYQKSEQAYIMSIEEGLKLLQVRMDVAEIDAVLRPRINIATLYNTMGNHEKAKQYGTDAYEHCELLYVNFPEAYVNEYILLLKELAVANQNLGFYDLALQYIDKAIEVFPVNDFDTSSLLTNSLVELLDVKGMLMMNKGDVEGARKMLEEIKAADATYRSRLGDMIAK